MSGKGEVLPTKGSNDGPWNKDKKRETVRAPKGMTYSLETNNEDVYAASNSGGKPPDSNDVLLTSKLNVHAAEFVPQTPQNPPPEDMSYLAEAIDVLSMSPGRYQEFLPPIEEIVKSVINDQNALGIIIDVFIKQCIAEPNFRYTGARLCRDFSVKFGTQYIQCLLNRCSQYFEQMPAFVKKDMSRVAGFGFLLAELYLQIKMSDNSHLNILATPLIQILNMILENPIYENVRTAVQILKLCGKTLQDQGVAHQQIFIKLEQLRDSQTVDENSKRIIAGLEHLRRTEWSIIADDVSVTSYTAEESYSEPVFYSPDGQVMSEEERSFLYDNIPMSEDPEDYVLDNPMDDEASAAYDEFLLSTHNNYHHH